MALDHFKTIFEFQALLKEFNLVYRDLGSLRAAGDPDNDVEHSYRVAMLCWMIKEEYELPLDTAKLLRYALIHDLVEVYAGDVSIHSEEGHKEKAQKEHEALLTLKEKFPRLKALWDDIEVYEKREDEESKFVYVIEKLEPELVILLSERDHYTKRKISYEEFVLRTQKKICSIDSAASSFNEEIQAYVKEHRKELFDE